MSTTIAMSARTLRMMLAGVLPHADQDDTLPVLCAVKMEVRSGVLYLAATDRYSIGVTRQRIPGRLTDPGADLDALINVGDAEKLFGLLAGHTGAAVLTLGDEQPAAKLTADLGDCPATTWQAVTLHTDSPEWPSPATTWRSVLYPALSEEAAALDDGFGVEMRLLGRFAAIDPTPYSPGWDPEEDEPEPEWPAEGCRMRIVRPAAPMVLVTRGEWFIGGAMACRLNRGSNHIPPTWEEWAGALAPSTTGGAAS